jgi:hypothetical protein
MNECAGFLPLIFLYLYPFLVTVHTLYQTERIYDQNDKMNLLFLLYAPTKQLRLIVGYRNGWSAEG